MNYNDYLNTAHWKERRETYFRAYGKKCQLCHSKRNIHIHHRRYNDKNGNILYWERLSDLIALCGSCHSYWHSLHGHTYMDKKIESNILILLEIGFLMKPAMQLVVDKKTTRRIITDYKNILYLISKQPHNRTQVLAGQRQTGREKSRLRGLLNRLTLVTSARNRLA
jgi:hypothetical protein